MLRKVFTLMIAIGLVGGVIGAASALFTDTQTVNANAFTSGTVDIATDPTTALVTFENMAPGDQVTAPITVTNSGTLDLRYALTSITTNADSKNLAAQLDLTIISVPTEGDCITSAFDAPAPGDVIYATGDLGSITTGINLIGNPATGAQTGDHTLAPDADEVLCFNVELPLSTGNAYQNAATTATLNFAAEQTTNN